MKPAVRQARPHQHHSCPRRRTTGDLQSRLLRCCLSAARHNFSPLLCVFFLPSVSLSLFPRLSLSLSAFCVSFFIAIKHLMTHFIFVQLSYYFIFFVSFSFPINAASHSPPLPLNSHYFRNSFRTTQFLFNCVTVFLFLFLLVAVVLTLGHMTHMTQAVNQNAQHPFNIDNLLERYRSTPVPSTCGCQATTAPRSVAPNDKMFYSPRGDFILFIIFFFLPFIFP